MRHRSILTIIPAVALLAAVLSVPVEATGTTLWVNGSAGSYSPPGTDCQHPGYPTIDAAVAAAASGDTIRVCPGTYQETVPVTTPDLSLIGASGQGGQGCSASMTPDPSTETIIDSTGPEGIVLDANGISFQGFWVQGNAGGPGLTTFDPYSGYQLADNVFYNNVFGAYFNASGANPSAALDSCFSSNNQIGSASGNGIYEDEGLTNAVISGDQFVDDASSGIVLITASSVGVTADTSSGDGSLIAIIDGTGGTIDHNRVDDDTGTAIYVCGAAGLGIGHNEIEGGGGGLYVDGSVDGCTQSTDLGISDNHVRGTASGGIYVASDSLTASLISHNNVQNTQGDGIHFDSGGNTISDNQVVKSTGYDCYDSTTGTGTDLTGNTWYHDHGAISYPSGICSNN